MPINPYPPPMTLSAREREVLDAMPDDLRRWYENEAGRLEFIDNKSLSEAEAGAFEAVMGMAAARGAGK